MSLYWSMEKQGLTFDWIFYHRIWYSMNEQFEYGSHCIKNKIDGIRQVEEGPAYKI